MNIRSKVVRLSIFLSTIVISIIILVQVFWLYKIYKYEEKEFDHHVLGILKETYANANLITDPSLNLNELVSKAKPQVYFAKIQRFQQPDSVVHIINDAFDDFDIFTDCHISFYDPQAKRFLYEADIHSTANNIKTLTPLPQNIQKPNYKSIILYFPNREAYILSNMLFWIVSSALLLGVLIWLGASIFFLYRQKTFNELQKDFVNNFTHEFKTPLSVIMLAAESLKKQNVLKNPDRINNYADMVQFQSQYLQGQIDRLLRHSFSENSELILIKEPIDVNDLIDTAVHNLQPLIEEKNAMIEVDRNADKTKVLGDKNYLLIVFINLIENALKYSSQPKVVISTGNEKGMIKISVKDNGIGIDEKYFHQIFKKFFRVPKGDIHPSKGFGIGLSFVKKILDSHHGQISVKSVPGIGSDFTISLHQNDITHA